MKKNILGLLSLLLLVNLPICRAKGQSEDSHLQKEMASYYALEPSEYLKIDGDSIVVDRKVNLIDYVHDTLRTYFDYLWMPSAYEGLATYFTYAVKAGDFWQCNDYYNQSKKEFRWGFFENQQLTIPVGPFKQYYMNGQMRKKGYFKNGKKAGVWEWFNKEGQLVGKSKYKDGVRIGYCFRVLDGDTLIRRLDGLGAGYVYKKLFDGQTLFLGKYLAGGVKDSIWNHYDEQGRLWYTEQFKTGVLRGELCYDTNGVVITTDTAFQMPHFKYFVPGYLERHVHFPNNLGLNISSGKIVAQFVIMKDGRVSKVKILQSLEPHFDYQVIRALERMPKWTPGKDHGRVVEYSYVVPFTFRNE